MSDKHILILCEGDISRDPRVFKQILAFQGFGKIYTVANSPSGIEDHFFEIYPKNVSIKDNWFDKLKRRLLFFLNYMEYYTWRGETNRQLLRNIEETGIEFDLIIANELRTLPVAKKLRKGHTRLHFDAHELYLHDTLPNTVDEMYKRYDRHLLLNYASKADTFSTVCDAIAKEYKTLLKRDILVFQNVPLYFDLEPSSVDGNNIKIVYHGIAMKNRSIERIISAFSKMPTKFQLFLALVPFHNEPETIEDIKRLALANKNVHLIDPFPMSEIPIHLNKFDISLCFFERTTRSIEFALPNKFFEGIQARLCLACSPNLEMKEITIENRIGVVSTSFDIIELFKIIGNMTPDEIFKHKQMSSLISREYSFDNVQKKYLKLLNS